MIGSLLKYKRIQYGYSLQEISSYSHISVTHLSNIERGRRYPSIEFLLSIEQKYKMRIDFSMREDPKINKWLEEGITVIYKGEFEAFQQIREKILKRELTLQSYFMVELLLGGITPSLLRETKMLGLIKQLRKKKGLESLEEALCIFIIRSSSIQGEYKQALNIYDVLVNNLGNQERRIYLEMSKQLLKLEIGKQVEVIQELPELKEFERSVIDKKYFQSVWYYTYGQCLLYYGIIEEARNVLEKVVIKYADNTKKEIVICRFIAKILLYTYTESRIITEKEILKEFWVNRYNTYFLYEIEPYVYTLGTTLLGEQKSKLSLKLIKFIQQKLPLDRPHPNKLFYEFMLSEYFAREEQSIALSEEYFFDKKNIESNPFQALYICKSLIRLFERKKQYKKAAHWGKIAIKVSDLCVGSKNLVLHKESEK